MPEPTKDELRKEIAAILKDANLEETAAKKVRLQLEANLKCDLSARKKEVDDLVMDYVNAQDESAEEEEEDEEEEEEAPRKKQPKKKQDSEDEEEEDEEEEDEEDSEDDKKKKGKRGAPAKRGPAKKKKRGSDSEEESEESDDDYKPKKGPKAGPKKGGRKKKGSDSDSDEDWKKPKAAKAKKAAGAKKGGGRGTGFTRPYNLSPELAAICGAEALPRHEVVKKVWTIIKERNLYDPKNKQYAICDSELQKVIGVKRFRTFGMLKYLKPHFLD